ncbi:MarR family winged helix-turn-helix transcriptional regulator [Paenibacillus sp. B01]|uniref:MarR family winged helix-turn-helix transcriptional regulator n=1 Tax=Paenibacillus sp. B01 TaxID=2660554 RepID=UPI00129A497E|nr:MarR family transcriptional regulator [Paenibacillus sp. B01]QGG58281.1 MarR family transcriptional regulator [Paenibacillus sp. B01]
MPADPRPPQEAFLDECLFFSANRIARAITRMAEEAFAPTGMSPMYAYVVKLAAAAPGSPQKELAEKLAIAPSTLTRFLDKLELQGLVRRRGEGKSVRIDPTDAGLRLVPELNAASRRLRGQYEALLGPEAARALSDDLTAASAELQAELRRPSRPQSEHGR